MPESHGSFDGFWANSRGSGDGLRCMRELNSVSGDHFRASWRTEKQRTRERERQAGLKPAHRKQKGLRRARKPIIQQNTKQRGRRIDHPVWKGTFLSAAT